MTNLKDCNPSIAQTKDNKMIKMPKNLKMYFKKS